MTYIFIRCLWINTYLTMCTLPRFVVYFQIDSISGPQIHHCTFETILVKSAVCDQETLELTDDVGT
jgi:hypothetical protein